MGHASDASPLIVSLNKNPKKYSKIENKNDEEHEHD